MLRLGVRTSSIFNTQHVATGWPDALNKLHPTILRYVAFRCCDRLAGAWKCWGDNVGGYVVLKCIDCLLALAGVDSLVLVGQKIDRGKIKSSSVAVRHFCSRPIRARRCRTVYSSAHWKMAMLSAFVRSFTNGLKLYLPQ